MPNFKDLTGDRYGAFTVIEQGQRSPSNRITWSCLCDCGSVSDIIGNNLRTGMSTNCGCLRRRPTYNPLIHEYPSEYRSWAAMKNRCTNTRSPKYGRWGGRGIAVCPEWLESFDTFLEDMGAKPEAGLSIDRIDNEGNYHPANCRWATPKQQANNKRNNR